MSNETYGRCGHEGTRDNARPNLSPFVRHHGDTLVEATYVSTFCQSRHRATKIQLLHDMVNISKLASHRTEPGCKALRQWQSRLYRYAAGALLRRTRL